MSTLTKGQAFGYNMLQNFCDSPRDLYAEVTGSAGTGKTYLLRSVPKNLVKEENIIMTAPTNKAVKVIQEMLIQQGLFNVVCMTIHRFLGLSVKNVKDKQVSFRRDDYDPSIYEKVAMVIVDEAPMLDGNLMDFVEEDAIYFGRKYVFVGDMSQLPPVEGDRKRSRCFDLASDKNKVLLTEIVRQAADNPIIKLATGIRDAIAEGYETPERGSVNEETGQGVYCLRYRRWVAKMEELFSTHDSHVNVDFARVVCYTNDTCKKYNNLIRERRGQDISVPFSVGDTVVVNSAYQQDGEVILGTGQEVVVTSLEEGEHPILGYKHWKVSLSTLEGIQVPVFFYVLAEECMYQRKVELNNLARICEDTKYWGPYYGLKHYYIDLRPPYSITAHKSQGSTFQNVFVDLSDIYSNKRQSEADKCYYVAVTRASHAVYLLV